MYYSDPVYRPPSEGKNSLLLTVTIGCSYKCTFCLPYRQKKFSQRSLEDIYHDINIARQFYGDSVERIFLLDGNAFVLKPDVLIAISTYCYRMHPNLRRISAYAHAKDILRKSDAELKQIAQAGLTLVYLGIESGDDQVLQMIHKQTTAQEIVTAVQKLHRAGIIFSGTIILGLAGNDVELSTHHAVATGRLVNLLAPPIDTQVWYISALSLMVPPTTPLFQAEQSGEFHQMDAYGMARELYTIIAETFPSLRQCVFRSNHASNYLVLKGILAQDRRQFLDQISYTLDHPECFRPAYFRGL